MTICMSCTTDENEISFPTVREFVAHEKSGHKIMPKVEAAKPVEAPKTADNPPPVPVQPGREPITLVYKFLGSCEICNGVLDTIEVPLGDKIMLIAYCPTDRKQWTSRNVIPINKQITEVLKKK